MFPCWRQLILFLGYLGPSGLHNNNETQGVDCVGGSAGYIDRQFFGINHIYSNPTSKAVYKSGPFDPEGLLGNDLIFQWNQLHAI